MIQSLYLTHSFYLSALVHCFSLSYCKGSANSLPHPPHIIQSLYLTHSFYLSALVHCFSLSSCKGSANSLPHPPTSSNLFTSLIRFIYQLSCIASHFLPVKGQPTLSPTPYMIQSLYLTHSFYLSALVHSFSLSYCKGSANSLPHPLHDPISLPHSFVLFISSRALLLTFLL